MAEDGRGDKMRMLVKKKLGMVENKMPMMVMGNQLGCVTKHKDEAN